MNVTEEVGHRKRCPDCWYPLIRDTPRALQCPNPDCPVINVIHSREKPQGRIKRITRAAVSRS